MRKWKDEERNQSGKGANTVTKKLALLLPIGFMALYLGLYGLEWYLTKPDLIP